MVVRYYPGAGPYDGRHVSFKGYDHNQDCFPKIAVSGKIRHAVADLTGNALEFAQLIAPSDTRQYQASFHSNVEILPDFPDRQGFDPPFPRWVGTVYNDAPNAVVVEVGAKATPAYRVFQRTLAWLELVAHD